MGDYRNQEAMFQQLEAKNRAADAAWMCRAAVAPPVEYKADHAEALRRRGLKADDK